MPEVGALLTAMQGSDSTCRTLHSPATGWAWKAQLLAQLHCATRTGGLAGGVENFEDLNVELGGERIFERIVVMDLTYEIRDRIALRVRERAQCDGVSIWRWRSIGLRR